VFNLCSYTNPKFHEGALIVIFTLEADWNICADSIYVVAKFCVPSTSDS